MSLYFLLAALFLLVLLVSKMSANMKSLMKDDHWVQRVELVLDRMGRAGIQPQESIVDILHDASMSNFAWTNHNAPAAAGKHLFGLAGGYGSGIGAKHAIAPPNSGAEVDQYAIAAGNMGGDNTVDGSRGMICPAEAHL
jgi:hypothetical protein